MGTLRCYEEGRVCISFLILYWIIDYLRMDWPMTPSYLILPIVFLTFIENKNNIDIFVLL
ncbi:unnamed protein product [Rodentolepis nana]|uniref:Uncharacterized protein n=1 Tax=Rodentolepis nana TaxID=102285 RepID=A0A0R3T413_RODNA|nr:unnamed protein product [Rodentolepis nana]